MEEKIVTREYALENGLKRYFTGERCKNGHISEKYTSNHLCVECHNINAKKYKENNRSKYLKDAIKYAEKNKERYKNYRNQNKEMIKNTGIIYRKKNKDILKIKKSNYLKNNREKVNKKYKERLMCDTLFSSKERIRSLIKTSISKNGYKKRHSTNKILGCSFEDFKIHIEKQFTKGMSWDNRGEWHIDHIVPISSAKTEEEVILLNHFTNLRPMWAIENIRKGNRMEFLL